MDPTKKILKVILFGASGMVGAAILNECLRDENVTSILAVGRRNCGRQHAKLRELLLCDLFKLSEYSQYLRGFNTCFYSIGASAVGMKEAEYKRVNHDLPIQTAQLLLKINPDLGFCYLSGQGTDSTEKGPVMWARIKGQTENVLLQMPFRVSVMFRLGAMIPLKGFKSRTVLYRVSYDLVSPLLPMIGKLFPGSVTTPRRLGRAMIRAARGESEKPILGPREIHEFGGDFELTKSV